MAFWLFPNINRLDKAKKALQLQTHRGPDNTDYVIQINILLAIIGYL